MGGGWPGRKTNGGRCCGMGGNCGGGGRLCPPKLLWYEGREGNVSPKEFGRGGPERKASRGGGGLPYEGGWVGAGIGLGASRCGSGTGGPGGGWLRRPRLSNSCEAS